MSAPFHPRAVNTTTLAALIRSGAGATRVLVELSAEDRAAYGASKEGITRETAPGPWVSVTERLTGTPIRIRVAPCGFRCVCDMEADVQISNQKETTE